MPAMIPRMVALAPSFFAYSTMGLLSTIWKDSALNPENKNALCRPTGKEGRDVVSADGCVEAIIRSRISIRISPKEEQSYLDYKNYTS